MVGADFLQREGFQGVLEIRHPHPHVGPQVGPTTDLSLHYPKQQLKRASPIQSNEQ